jgi:hypothetical protein
MTTVTNSVIAPPLDNSRRSLLFLALITSIFFSNPYFSDIAFNNDLAHHDRHR